MLPLHWKSCFDRNTPHITEFATVAKSLPHSLRKAHKSLISNIFLFQYRFFRQKASGGNSPAFVLNIEIIKAEFNLQMQQNSD